LDRYLAAGRTPAVLVAHSLGCVLVAHWVERSRRGQIAGPMPAVAAAMLVAPGDVDQERPGFEVVQPFAPMPLPRFPFPSIVVASTDDFFVSAERARHFARGWGSDYLCVGAMGHISVETGCGPWPRGLAVLADFLRRQVPPRP
jgi:hypothetical protein